MAQPLPPGLDLNHIPIDPVSTPKVIGSLIMYPVLIVLTTIAISLRFLTKIYFFKIGWDDWLMLFAVLFYAVHAASLMSMHLLVFQKSTIPASTMAKFTDLLLVVETFFTWSMLLFKAALGVWFWKLLKEKWQRWLLIFVMACSVIIGVAHFLFMIFMCGVPNIDGPFWKRKLLGQCASVPVVLGFGYSHALANALTDLIVFGLPIPMVWRSRICRRDKIIVSFIFAMAALGGAAAIVRFFFVKSLGATGPDLWVQVQGLCISAAIELGLGLTAASFGTLRPLFRHFVKVVRSYRSTISTRSGSKFGYKSGNKSSSNGFDSHVQHSDEHDMESNLGRSEASRQDRKKTFLLDSTVRGSTFHPADDKEGSEEEYDRPRPIPYFSTLQNAQASMPPTMLPPSYGSGWPLPDATQGGTPRKDFY